MRILHTADWHIGKLFYGGYLTEDQAYVLDEQFLPMVKEENIDAVVLAGDVYDRSLPPAEAVELFDTIATKITKDLGVPFYVISGNHDSATRLSFGSDLLAAEGLHLYGDLEKLTGPAYIEDIYGTVALVPLPFAEPALIRHFYGNTDVTDQESALQQLMTAQTAGIPAGMRTVAIAHVFVAGGVESESERPLSIGGTDVVSAKIFLPFTYTALGHLHGPQQVSSPVIRYAGSLLKYSFSEATQKKGAVVVDIDGEGKVETTFLPFTPKRDVRVITGFYDDIMKRPDENPDDFILVRLEDREPILDGMAKIRKKYPHTLALETPNRQYAASGERNIQVQHMSEADMFAQFVHSMRPDAPLSAGEEACLQDLWQALAKEEGGLL